MPEHPAPGSSAGLDFLSAHFDPLLALYTAGLQPPNPRARPLDNLRKCRGILPPGDPNYNRGVATQLLKHGHSVSLVRLRSTLAHVRCACAIPWHYGLTLALA